MAVLVWMTFIKFFSYHIIHIIHACFQSVNHMKLDFLSWNELGWNLLWSAMNWICILQMSKNRFQFQNVIFIRFLPNFTDFNRLRNLFRGRPDNLCSIHIVEFSIERQPFADPFWKLKFICRKIALKYVPKLPQSLTLTYGFLRVSHQNRYRLWDNWSQSVLGGLNPI